MSEVQYMEYKQGLALLVCIFLFLFRIQATIQYKPESGEYCGWNPNYYHISYLSTYNLYAPPASNGSACIKNHYLQGRINHWCIGSFMYKSPYVTLTGVKGYLREVSGPIQPLQFG